MDNVVEIKSKHYIQNLIEEGEHEQQDFKFKISDSRKIARSISAFANNKGGHLLIGVKDNGRIAGIESDEEIYMIEQAAEMYCKPPQKVKYQIYRVEGKSVLKVDIDIAEHLPVKAQDDDKKWKAYYRVADENIIASPLHVKVWQYNDKAKKNVIEYTDCEKVIVEYLEDNEYITLQEFMMLAHISKQRAEEAVVKLCSVGALQIAYNKAGCVIKLVD